MFTPQRLFGEVGSSPDVLAHEAFLERARLQREQERDGSARLALGAYVVARLVDRLLALEHDLAGLEGFRWQLGAVRRHVDELPPDAPESAHLAGIVAAVPKMGRPTSALWLNLTAFAYFLEHEGRLDEALEMLILAARTQGSETSTSDFAAYALAAGRLNRHLARWEAATACYAAAEEAGANIGNAVVRLRGQLGRGAVDRGRGNLPVARTIAESVVSEANQLELLDVLVMAYSDLSAVYSLQGLRIEALQANYQAFQLAQDIPERMRALSDLAIDLREIEAYEAARLAFQLVTQSNSNFLVRANALLELMDLEAFLGNRVAFERCRTEASQLHDRMSPSMTADYHFKLGTGLARFGKLERAREAFTAGLVLAEAHRLNTWYFTLEQALAQLSLRQEPEPQHRETSEPNYEPMVSQVMLGLREYASLAGAG